MVLPYLNAAQAEHPALAEAHRTVRHRYKPFDGFALTWYRDGRDGQAFHRDTDMRWLDDTVVAILTLGAAIGVVVPVANANDILLNPVIADVDSAGDVDDPEQDARYEDSERAVPGFVLGRVSLEPLDRLDEPSGLGRPCRHRCAHRRASGRDGWPK